MRTAVLALLVVILPAAGAAERATLRGKLRVSPEGATLETSVGITKLGRHDRNLAATLADPRLAGRSLEVVGEKGAEGTFDVHELYVTHPDARYRLIYFCQVCNIVTFAPGECACCQQPVEPVEVLPTDPRIYHEEIAVPGRSPEPAKSGKNSPPLR
jgi:hypothetical protein